MRRTQILFLLVILAAVVLLHRPLRRLTITAIRLPLVIAESALGTLVRLPQLPRLSRENAALRSELAAQHLELAGLREAVRHLTRTHQLHPAIDGPPGIVAAIIGRSILPAQHTVLLEKGARDGLVPRGALIDADGLVGQVLEAAPTTSLVMLVTDPNSRIGALVERSREHVLVIGTGARLCQLQYLDEETDLALNDRVVTADLGGPFPKGIVIGTVTRIERDEPHGRVQAWVTPAVRVNRLEEVRYVPPAAPPVTRE